MKPGIEGDYLRYTKARFNARELDSFKAFAGFRVA
jgi:hypothetical protein